MLERTPDAINFAANDHSRVSQFGLHDVTPLDVCVDVSAPTSRRVVKAGVTIVGLPGLFRWRIRCAVRFECVTKV